MLMADRPSRGPLGIDNRSLLVRWIPDRKSTLELSTMVMRIFFVSLNLGLVHLLHLYTLLWAHLVFYRWQRCCLRKQESFEARTGTIFSVAVMSVVFIHHVL